MTKNLVKWLENTLIQLFFINRLRQQFRIMKLITPGPFEITSPFPSRKKNKAKGNQWLKQELIKYAVYLKFSSKFKGNGSQADSNSWSFFRQLSVFVQSKNPNQCRIFHKKMMSQHSSVSSLLYELKSTIQKFEEWEQHYQSALMNLKTCLSRERQENQKELTNKTGVTQKSFDLSLKGDEEIDNATKNKNLKPTATEYFEGQNELYMKSSIFQKATNTARPASTLFAEEESLSGVDMSGWLSKPPLPKVQPLKNQISVPFNESEQRWQLCNNVFQSYLGMLKSLMSSSVSNY